MIHKKGGRIRTYGRPAPDLLGWVAGLAPLVASVPETDAPRYPARNLVSPTPLLVMPLPIAGNPRAGQGQTGLGQKLSQVWGLTYYAISPSIFL